MNRIKLWPHATLIIIACAIFAGLATLLWFKYEQTAQAKELPNAARIQQVTGQVALNHSLDESTKTQWVDATINTPISVGDRVLTRDNSQTEVALTGRNFATLEANSSLDILDLSDQKTQLALRNGSALFDVGALASGQLFEVATPCGAVDLDQPGIYRVEINDSGNAAATAFSGEAELVGEAGSGKINKGQTLSIPCQGNASASLSPVDYGQAGNLIDTYYRYRYPKIYDGRYRNYYTYLNDPYYYDPSRRYISYKYVSDYIPGVDDLDDYGNWEYVSDYGYCWHPYVEAGWAPYESGYWSMDYPYGLTWISNEPWGYAPYHYGRWVSYSSQWYWIPDRVSTRPIYSPALVAFIPFSDSTVGWVALGPSDPYTPHYYDPNWQAIYFGRRATLPERLVNLRVPGAVIDVPIRDFNREIDPRVINRVDPQMIARTRPVLDPLTVDPLRQQAFRTRETRRVDLPEALTQRLSNTRVITSTSPRAQVFRRDLARTMQVQAVPDRIRNQKLRITQAGQMEPQRGQFARNNQPGNVAAEQQRERQIADLSRQAARGDRNARQQMEALRKQQSEQQSLERSNAQTPQGERTAQRLQQRNSFSRAQQQLQRAAAQSQMMNSRNQQRAATEMRRLNQQQRPIQTQRNQPPQIRSVPNRQPLRTQVRPETRSAPRYQRPVQPRVLPSQPMRAQSRYENRRQAMPQPMRVRPQVQPQPRVQRQPPQMMRAPRPVQNQPRPNIQVRPQQQARPQARPQPQPRSQPGARHKPPGR